MHTATEVICQCGRGSCETAYDPHVEHHTTSPEYTLVWPSVSFFAFAAAIAASSSHFLATEPLRFFLSSWAFVDVMRRHILQSKPLLIPEICMTFCGICLPGL